MSELETILGQSEVSGAAKTRLVLSMSVPAILAELTSIAMQYIDAAMVGSLGANATGAIGLVSSSTWLVSGLCIGMATGFSVQVAQLIGGQREKEARDVLRQALGVLLLMGLVIGALGILIGGPLPHWLGGAPEICADATVYFRIYTAVIPFGLMRQLSASMMQCSGDMKTPSMLSALVCLLDVILNFFLIFPSRTISLLGVSLFVPGAGLDVAGAALGTALAEALVCMQMLFKVCVRNPKLNLKSQGDWRWKKKTILTAVRLAVPMSLDHIFMCTAYVAGTFIVAPLGTISVAANSLAVTAESLCYMPGYGIGSAATAIIGQTIGAERRDLTYSFSRLSVALAMALMGCTAVLMYVLAPFAFAFLTSDAQVAALGTKVLRIELLAEPLYGASICCAGVFRGAGDTLVPSILNLVSMWGVRIMLAAVLVPKMGLQGYWVAMCAELCFRGIIFLIRLFHNRWMKQKL